MALQLDDSFLNDLGLGNIPEQQKQTFLLQVLEMLESRVGLRLAEELTDEQVVEFEQVAPREDDSEEMSAQKQQAADEWLRENHPGYEDLVNEELALLKHDLGSNLDAILEKPTI
jgi:hypothetical protein